MSDHRRKAEEATRRRRAIADAEAELDSVYTIQFRKKGTSAETLEQDRYFPMISLRRDPRTNQENLEHAFWRFQTDHNVSDWRKIAEDYRMGSYWSP